MSSNEKKLRQLLIWDLDEPIENSEYLLMLWRGHSCKKQANIFAINKILENKSIEIKTQYLAWIFELGNAKFNGKKLLNYLRARPGFSYWWMSLLVEKCNFSKSREINSALKIMALNSWIDGKKGITHIILESDNEHLADSISMLCKLHGLIFEYRPYKDGLNKDDILKSLYKNSPIFLKSLIRLVFHYYERWPLSNMGINLWGNTRSKVTLVSYFLNINSSELLNGRYRSNYWGGLTDFLAHEGHSVNYLHIYVKNPLFPTAKSAAQALKRLNSEGRHDLHITLDSFLSLRIFLITLYTFFKINFLFIKLFKFYQLGLQAVDNSKVSNESKFIDNLIWPLLKNDFRESLIGPTSIINILNLNLIESAFKGLPKQDIGIYLQENQGWEYALNYCWKRFNHEKLYGMPHSTVRYWDMRYFYDLRNIGSNDEFPMPLPNKVLVNGIAMRSAYEEWGYPNHDLIDVEALRYLELEGLAKKAYIRPSSDRIRILMLGDYLFENTNEQLHFLHKAVLTLNKGVDIIFKPHPACIPNKKFLDSRNANISLEPIHELLLNCDLVFSGSLTSAAVDAHCVGVPVIIMLENNELNMSPLRNEKNVFFVTSIFEFQEIFSSFNFLKLDRKLSKWKELFKLNLM